jgi:succinate dehydrogenase / fumarate reductase, membrane anchor subunit
MVTRRQAVGAHYGLKDWLLQRLTAIVMGLYTLLLLAIALWHGGIDHALWQALFAATPFKAATFLFMAALLYHAWVGARDIFMDYVKPVGVRLALQSVTVGLLIVYLGWTIQILWGGR